LASVGIFAVYEPSPYSIISLILAIVGYLLFGRPSKNEWKQGITSVLNHEDASMAKSKVEGTVDFFESLYGTDSRAGGKEHAELLAKRQTLYTQMVNSFYDLVTDFYEYGWGESFHFAPRHRVESFHDSLRRHECFLALRLGLNESTVCADIGCGVGGPMRAIARFSGSKIVGINNNEYQIKVATKHNVRDNLSHLCSFVKTDFMKLTIPDNQFEHAYAIESTCHAPDKLACFREIFRVMKPGGLFAGYEWVMTSKYDASNEYHRNLKQGIEVGNGLPDIATIPVVLDAFKKAGFEVITYDDLATGCRYERTQVPWFVPLEGEFSITGFRMTKFGRGLTHQLVKVLEFCRIAPKGSVKVSKLLNDTAIDLVEAGRLGIFTPNLFFLVRKPVA